MMQVKPCSKCEAPIVWCSMLKTGAKMPLNHPPEKRVIVTHNPAGEPIGEVVDTYLPHWATCPYAAEFKR